MVFTCMLTVAINGAVCEYWNTVGEMYYSCVKYVLYYHCYIYTYC